MNPGDIIKHLLGEAAPSSPFERPGVTLEYRPYKHGDFWKWFWVILPDNADKALAHGEADSRVKASVMARIKARKLGVSITRVSTVEPYKEGGGTQSRGAATSQRSP